MSDYLSRLQNQDCREEFIPNEYGGRQLDILQHSSNPEAPILVLHGLREWSFQLLHSHLLHDNIDASYRSNKG
jgi:hypothetical protein